MNGSIPREIGKLQETTSVQKETDIYSVLLTETSTSLDWSLERQKCSTRSSESTFDDKNGRSANKTQRSLNRSEVPRLRWP